jgi:transglutaminase-like putative cysteine protease
VWCIAAVIAVTWVVNAAFFAFSPRLPAGLIQFFPSSFLSRMTGFSESVGLGEIGRILNNSSPVMHVRLRDKRGATIRGDHDLYWRGLTYQQYDGRKWKRLGAPLDGADALATRHLPYFLDLLTDRQFRELDRIEQEITLEPTGTQSLFALPGLIRLDSPEIRHVEKNCLDETYRSLARPRHVVKYSVSSVVPDRGRLMPPRLLPRGGRLTPELRAAYLQLPENMSERVAALARRIAPPELRLAQSDSALRVEQHLRSNFGYTLELDADPDAEPVEHFLFNARKGHCEYFASSMVLLMRCLGVPSRLATGFRGGEWNEVGEWYLVRQSDAHAWAEVHVDGEGWTLFDPTPAGSSEAGQVVSRLGSFGRWLDYLRTTWITHVVEYDEQQRSEILQHTRQASRQVRVAVLRALASVGRLFKSTIGILSNVKRLATVEGVLILTGVLAASTGVVLTARWLLLRLVRRAREWVGRRLARRPGRARVAFYQDLQRLLKRRGFERGAATTPREFAEQVAAQLETARQPLRELTEAFYRIRFGGAQMHEDEERRLRTVIELVSSASLSRPR